MRRDPGRGAVARSPRAGPGIEGRVITEPRPERLAAIALLLVAGCGGRTTPATSTEPSCRDLAVRGSALIAAAPEAERDQATRFVAETIDLCQAPGLAMRARTCLAGAATLAEARACPSLPTTGDDLDDPSGGEAPRCQDVVAHALALYGDDLEEDERADEEATLSQDCAATNADGRRCAAAAADLDAFEVCFDQHPLDPEDGDDGERDWDADLLDRPVAP